MRNRREIVFALLAAAAVGVAPPASAGPYARRRRRVIRRRIRRRHRRRVRRRGIAGASLLVVPTGLGVGWELVDADTVWIVTEVRPGPDREIVVLKDSAGRSKEEAIVREDDDLNSREIEGSVLSESDTTTPGVVHEIEEEVP